MLDLRLWAAVFLVSLEKDWLGYLVFLLMGAFAYPSPSLMLFLLVILVLLGIAAIRTFFTVWYISHKLSRTSIDDPISSFTALVSYSRKHIQGIFG